MGEIMKKAVMYGAGNIGRGFLGKTFYESNYEVCFIDINEEVISEINSKMEYPVKIVSNDSSFEDIVKNVSAVNGNNLKEVAKEIANCDIMAMAVGVNVIKYIIKPLCEGIKLRKKTNNMPLNIIICENLIGADKYIKKLLIEELGSEYIEYIESSIGLVKASIGRMVPIMSEEMKEGNILKVWVEPYSELPVDSLAFKGEIPKLKGLLPYTPFDFYIKRKLFIHNMGHAMSAYLGAQKGYEYIYECMEDEKIKETVTKAMCEVSVALNKEFSIAISEINENVFDLISRFQNRRLQDTVLRVGRDPKRKLKRTDRLTGAALYCIKMNVGCENIKKGIVAAIKFSEVDIEEGLIALCELEKEEQLYKELR